MKWVKVTFNILIDANTKFEDLYYDCIQEFVNDVYEENCIVAIHKNSIQFFDDKEIEIKSDKDLDNAKDCFDVTKDIDGKNWGESGMVVVFKKGDEGGVRS